MAQQDPDQRGAILEAMAEFDGKKRIPWLHEHGFRVSRGYLVVHEDSAGVPQRYDSKFIVARAHFFRHGTMKQSGEFSGGQQTVVKELRNLGFGMVEVPRDWTDDELVLVLHWYLKHRPRKLRVADAETVTLSSCLAGLARLRKRPEVIRVREPEDVEVQLMAFGSLDRGGGRPNQRVHVRHREIWAKYADDANRRSRRVRRILDALDRMLEDAGISWASPIGREVTETSPPVYAPRTKNRPKKPTKPYAGRRKVSLRRAAKLREDDPEKYDRSNKAHEDARVELATFLEIRGFDVEDPADSTRLDFDLAAVRGALKLVIEVKSLPENAPNAEPARLRLGLGQVLWYRRRFWSLYRQLRVAVLAVEREPRDAEEWLDVCRSVKVVLTWPARRHLLLRDCTRVQQGKW